MAAGGGADPRAHSLAQPLSTGMSIGIPRIATIPPFMRTPILALASFTCMDVATARFRGDTGLARSEKIAPQSRHVSSHDGWAPSFLVMQRIEERLKPRKQQPAPAQAAAK
jgi:hypothetical protein